MVLPKTIADRVIDANRTGREAIFFTDETNRTGAYEFTPDGLKDYIGDSTLVNQPTSLSRPSYVRSAQQWLDDYGVMAGPSPTGIEQAVVEAVATGRRVFIPAGDYDITSQITVASTLTKPLRLEFHPNANIILKSSLIGVDGCFLKVNNAGNQVVEIEGGNFNADAQPKPESGQSWAILSLTYVKGGGIWRSRFSGGADYLDEKSDSGIFCVAEEFTIDGCHFNGFWDSAIYSSGSSGGIRSYATRVVNSDFYGCEVGFISKRLGAASTVDSCAFRKCRVGAATGSAALQQPAGLKMIVSDNQFDDCTVPIYLEWADGSVVSNNRIFGWGHDVDGVLSSGTKGAIRLLGTQDAKIIGNDIKPNGSAVDAAMHGILMQQASFTNAFAVTTTKQCLYNTITDNDIDGGSGCGTAMYEANLSNSNHWVGNRLSGTWTLDYDNAGSQSVCQYWDSSNQEHLLFEASERMFVNSDGVRVVPSSAGRFTVQRDGVSEARIELFCDGGAHHIRGRTPAASAKPNLYESRTYDDTAVSGGNLGHTFTVAGVSSLVIGSTKFSAATALLTNYADDAAAAAGGLSIGDWYRTGSILKIRVA